MAKEDFCFTYYDGDADRDMAFMNKSERSSYFDLIRAQRNFGHLSKEQIIKILGEDYESHWASLELVLKKDTEDKYFIGWLENSIKKMRLQAIHQSENGKKGGRPKSQLKANLKPTEIQLKPESNPIKIQKKPLENGDGNRIKEGVETIKEIQAEPEVKPKPRPPEEVFDAFRKLYGGSKRGNQTEFDNFKKKTKNWQEILPHLEKVIRRQIDQRNRDLAISGKFVPEWKNLQTWINQKCWEQEQSESPVQYSPERQMTMREAMDWDTEALEMSGSAEYERWQAEIKAKKAQENGTQEV